MDKKSFSIAVEPEAIAVEVGVPVSFMLYVINDNDGTVADDFTGTVFYKTNCKGARKKSVVFSQTDLGIKCVRDGVTFTSKPSEEDPKIIAWLSGNNTFSSSRLYLLPSQPHTLVLHPLENDRISGALCDSAGLAIVNYPVDYSFSINGTVWHEGTVITDMKGMFLVPCFDLREAMQEKEPGTICHIKAVVSVKGYDHLTGESTYDFQVPEDMAVNKIFIEKMGSIIPGEPDQPGGTWRWEKTWKWEGYGLGDLKKVSDTLYQYQYRAMVAYPMRSVQLSQPPEVSIKGSFIQVIVYDASWNPHKKKIPVTEQEVTLLPEPLCGATIILTVNITTEKNGTVEVKEEFITLKISNRFFLPKDKVSMLPQGKVLVGGQSDLGSFFHDPFVAVLKNVELVSGLMLPGAPGEEILPGSTGERGILMTGEHALFDMINGEIDPISPPTRAAADSFRSMPKLYKDLNVFWACVQNTEIAGDRIDNVRLVSMSRDGKNVIDEMDGITLRKAPGSYHFLSQPIVAAARTILPIRQVTRYSPRFTIQSLTAIPISGSLDSPGEYSQVGIRIADAEGNPIAGAKVSVKVLKKITGKSKQDPDSRVTVPAPTNHLGITRVKVWSTTPGTKTLLVSCAGHKIQETCKILFLPLNRILFAEPGGLIKLECPSPITQEAEKRLIGMELYVRPPGEGEPRPAHCAVIKGRRPRFQVRLFPDALFFDLQGNGSFDEYDASGFVLSLNGGASFQPQKISISGDSFTFELPVSMPLPLGPNRLNIRAKATINKQGSSFITGDVEAEAHFLVYEQIEDILVDHFDPEAQVETVAVTELDSIDIPAGEEPGQRLKYLQFVSDRIRLDFKEGTDDRTISRFLHQRNLLPVGGIREYDSLQVTAGRACGPMEIFKLAEKLNNSHQSLLEGAGLCDLYRPLGVATETYPPGMREAGIAGKYTFFQKILTGYYPPLPALPNGDFKPFEKPNWNHFAVATFLGHRLVDKIVKMFPLRKHPAAVLSIIDSGLGDGKGGLFKEDVGFSGPAYRCRRIHVGKYKTKIVCEPTNNPEQYKDYDWNPTKKRVDDHGTLVTTAAACRNSDIVVGTCQHGTVQILKMGFSWQLDEEIICMLKDVKGDVINFSIYSLISLRSSKFRKALAKTMKDKRIFVTAAGNNCYLINVKPKSFPAAYAPIHNKNRKGQKIENIQNLVMTAAGTMYDEKDKQVLPTWEKRWEENKGDKIIGSGSGKSVTVAAPSFNIFVFRYNGQTKFYSGTSFSAPQTAGLATEMIFLDRYLLEARQRKTGKELTRLQIVELIEATADDVNRNGVDQYLGHGRINAWKALLSTANGGVAQTSAFHKSLTVINDKDTHWYGFNIRSQYQFAHFYLDRGDGFKLLRDADNTEILNNKSNLIELCPPTDLKDVQTCKGVHIFPAQPMPVGYWRVNQGEFIARFSIHKSMFRHKHANKVKNKFSLLRMVPKGKSKDNYIVEISLDTKRMREYGSCTYKCGPGVELEIKVAFNHFVFDIVVPERVFLVRVCNDSPKIIAGKKFAFHYMASPYYIKGAWIEVVPPGSNQGNQNLSKKYELKGVSSTKQGTPTLIAPAVPGKYDLAMFDKNGKKLTADGFTVKEK